MASKIKGRVYRAGRGTWVYEVWRGNKMFLTDNTGNWRTVYEACMRDVESLKRIYIAGHKLTKTWDEILSSTKNDL